MKNSTAKILTVSYEEIVRSKYTTLSRKFVNVLMKKFDSLDEDDALDIYQDAFMAVYHNLQEGKVRVDTAWDSYIITIGINMASKRVSRQRPTERLGGEEEERMLPMLGVEGEEEVLGRLPEVQQILEEEIGRLPEAGAAIIRLTYYEGMKDAEILEVLDNYSNTKAIKSRRCQLMKQLKENVKRRLAAAGYLAPAPSTRQVA